MPKKIRANLKHMWSTTFFGPHAALNAYAEKFMVDETRRGLQAQSALLLLLLAGTAVFCSLLGLGKSYIYTYGALGLLSVHVHFSAGRVSAIKELYLLGMTLLIVSGAAIVLLAHQTGSFDAALFGSVVLLFMVVPMVPWGLREAGLIAFLIYVIFTVSTLSKVSRFSFENLLTLQFFMISACVISLVLVIRGVIVRKHDIQARFDLEHSHKRMQLLSYQDPLTGSWNRRYLHKEFDAMLAASSEAGRECRFFVFDIDGFKKINDTYGHAYGDRLLQWVCKAFNLIITHKELLVRMGGDEFAILLHGSDSHERIKQAIAAIQTYALEQGRTALEVPTLSIGCTRILPAQKYSLDQAYKLADEACYIAKKSGGNRTVENSLHVDKQASPVVAIRH